MKVGLNLKKYIQQQQIGRSCLSFALPCLICVFETIFSNTKSLDVRIQAKLNVGFSVSNPGELLTNLRLSDTVLLEGWLVQNLSAHLLNEFIRTSTFCLLSPLTAFFLNVCFVFLSVRQYSNTSCLFFMCLRIDLIIIYCHYYYFMGNWTL